MLKIGIIGYGRRGPNIVMHQETFDNVQLTAIADPRSEEIKAGSGSKLENISFYTSAEAMLANERLDGVIVATRCFMHPEMAVKVAQAGIPLFLEKPVAIDYAGLKLLRDTWHDYNVPTVVSFPLRFTPMIQRVKEIVESGIIGTVENVQAVNNVPYGETYYVNWYRNHHETGGLWLQKATHDIDYITYILGQKPHWIAAMKSQRVYGGSKSPKLRCAECPENQECMESPFNLYLERYVRQNTQDSNRRCLFASDIENEDNASCLIEFANGVQASYVQNFYARNHAALRGARFLGYKGTIDFDWYRGDILVHMHHTPRTERIAFDTQVLGPHFGGERHMARHFIDVMTGKAESMATLEDGILSALTCIKARESCESREFTRVNMPVEGDTSCAG